MTDTMTREQASARESNMRGWGVRADKDAERFAAAERWRKLAEDG
jgi:hypothetical protein